jgi:hypothetical protein
MLWSPTLDPATKEHEIPEEAFESPLKWWTDINRVSAKVYRGEADISAIEFLKAHYPLPEELMSTRTNTFAAVEARTALVYAGELDYVIEQDIWWAGQLDLNPHENVWTPFYSALRQHPRSAEYLDAFGIIVYWDATEWPDWCERGADEIVRCR